MARALEKHCGEVVPLSTMPSAAARWGRVRNKLSRMLLGRGVNYLHNAVLSRRYSRHYANLLRDKLDGNVDLIFVTAGSTQIALLDTGIPIVYTSDATFELMRDYYPDFTNLSRASAAQGNAIERGALQKAEAVLYPSAWAAQSARQFYNVDPSKIHVIPYGANLDCVPGGGEGLACSKPDNVCVLTFLGVDWKRKGGSIAYATLRALQAMGLRSRLVVCGCTPPASFRAEGVEVIPRLDKNRPTDQAALSNLLLSSNFLLLPTRRECYGIVFCEASAHGTPAIATDTGGVSGAVDHGRNGYLLPPTAGADEYARLIYGLFHDRKRYLDLVASSRAVFEERLNWDHWAVRVRELISGIG